MDYAQASAELQRMSAQYGSYMQEPTPSRFPDEFSTPGATRQRAPHIEIHGNYGSTPSAQPSFTPAFDASYVSFNSPGMESGPATPGPAVVEAYRELNNKVAVVNQQRIAAQRERDRLRTELDMYLKQEGLERVVRAQAVEFEELQTRQVRDHEREEVEKHKQELRRQMKQYEELRKAEEAANARHREAKQETKQLHKLLQELQSQSAHLERSLRASSEQVRRLERQLGDDRQARADEEEALRHKIDRLQQAIQAEMSAREEMVEKARRDEENLAHLAAAAREAISLSQAQQHETAEERRRYHHQQHQGAHQATAQFEEFLEHTRDSIRSLIERADDVLAAVKHVSLTEQPRVSASRLHHHTQATQTPGRQKSRAAHVEAPAHVSSVSGSGSGSRSGSSTGESMSERAFYEFSHSQSMNDSDGSDDIAMLEHIEGMIPRSSHYRYNTTDYVSTKGRRYVQHPRSAPGPPRRLSSPSKRRARPCERWAAPPPRKIAPASEPAPVPFIPSASTKSFNLIGNLSEAARDLKLSYPPHLLHDPENPHASKSFQRGFSRLRGTVDPAFQDEVEQLLLVELEDLEDRLEHLRNTSRDKSLIASLQDRIAHTREQLLGVGNVNGDTRHLSPERQRNTAMLQALQERRYYRQHVPAPPV